MMHPLDMALSAAIEGDQDKSEELLRGLDIADPRVAFNLGWHECRHGNLSKGLKLMDSGRLIGCYGLPRIPGPIWREEPLEGKCLLLRLEGGYGDQIMQVRFAQDFLKMGARLLISCAPSLKSFFNHQGLTCIDNEVVGSAHYDYWVPGMSAPHLLKYEYETLSGAPYLTSPKTTNLWNTGNFKVGIRWSGNPDFEHQQHRLFPRDLMINLKDTPGTTFYSFQRDFDLVEGLPFADLRASMTTWEDTAALLKDLNLLITSCTSIAHLGGALGVETWVVVPTLPYYPWAIPKDTSAWYNSVRIFRQKSYGEWRDTFAEVQAALLKKTTITISNV